MKFTPALIFAIASLSSLTVQAQEQGRGPGDWALKGVKLGSTVEELKASFANARCETYPDPAIQSCQVTTTLADKPAQFEVKYLDDKAVYVAVRNVDYDQAMEGVHALAEKYGTPTSSDKVKVYMTRPDSGSMRLVERPKWDGGNTQMYVKVADWTDEELKFTYSAIVLIDMHAHNDEWTVRFNRKGKPLAKDI